MSRSEFFSRAAARYLDELDAQSLVAQIDAALARVDTTDDSAAAAVNAGRRTLQMIDDEW